MMANARPFRWPAPTRPITWSTSPKASTPVAIWPASVVKGDRPTTLIQPSAVQPSVDATRW
jgi:hypothetical protein